MMHQKLVRHFLMFLITCLFFSHFLLGCASGEIRQQQAQLHLRIGTSLLIKGHYPQALSELLEAEKLDPTEPVIQNNLGLAYFVRREYGLSESHIKKAISFSPGYSDAKNNLGRVYIEQARYDDAISELLPVTKDLTYPSPEKCFVNLGLAYLKKGDMGNAQKMYKKSIESNSRFCPGYNYLGQAYFQQQKYEDAIQSFDTALSLCNSNYDEAHYYSALSYYKAGQKEKAEARFQEVIKLYPNSEYAAKSKSMLKIIQ
jgi:type IV pilus assembly protein PilF